MSQPNFTCSISLETVESVEATFAKSTIHGADIRFHGVVRDLEDDRPISGIEYTHYAEMAVSELEKICDAMQSEFPGHLAQIHHQIGFVAAGDASIIIRVQTAHSAEGFEISREYLRRIKTTVPIWKKPIFSDETSNRKG